MESTIAELRYYNEKFPRQALEEAIKNKEQTTEILLNELDYMIGHPESTIENNEYNLHFLLFIYWLNLEKKKLVNASLTWFLCHQSKWILCLEI